MAEAEIVGVETGVSVEVGCGNGVAAGKEVNATVGDCSVAVLVAG